MIRLFDVSLPRSVQAELENAVLATLRSGQFILGERVARFEQTFAEAFRVTHAVGVGSGTDALVLALRALGIGPGDEVIVPALSFYASAEAVLLVGAEPVLVDVDADTLTLSVDAARSALTPRTAALLPVHLYGRPADMPALMELAAQANLAVIEDAAQAVGATSGGEYVGRWGDACCYSFYPTKNLGAAGDGGMLTTRHGWLADKVRQLREHAKAGTYYHDDVGYTSRLDALQAAVLSIKLTYLEAWNVRRREHAQAYDLALGSLEGLQTLSPHLGHVYHLYNLRSQRRDALMQELNRHGVESRVYYPHTLADLPPLSGKAPFEPSVAQAAVRELFAIPAHQNLRDQERERVIEAVSDIVASGVLEPV